MFFQRGERREILILNVIPLIDISAMIIIFLVMGSVFGDTSVMIPPGVVLPTSDNKEQVLNAPQVTINGDHVIFNLLPENIPLKEFSSESPSPLINQIRSVAKSYISNLKKEDLAQGVMLNLVAAKSETYQHIFDVLKVFREAGFQSILFLSQGK